MDLLCFEVEPGRVEVRPMSHRRTWMDETPHGFAYRCIPLSVANAHGWEMLCPVSFAATWNGGAAPKDVAIKYTDPAEKSPEWFLDSHFGSGILTFNPMLMIKTAPGYDLWVSGPPNQLKDGIGALSACVETDWMPFTFTMNWKFTRAKQWIRFQKGEPFCAFFPVQRGAVEACEPVKKPLSTDQALLTQYMSGKVQRNLGQIFAQEVKDNFQSWYARGVEPTGAPAQTPSHRVASRPKPFSPAE